METQDNEKIEEIEKVENIETTQELNVEKKPEPEVEETKDQKTESITDSSSKTSKNNVNLPPFVLAIIVLIIVVNLCYILYNIHLLYKPELLVDADVQVPNTYEHNLDIKLTKITLSKDSFFIANVPYINQFSLGYPTGCEAVSATMAAQYAGYNVSSAQIISATPTDTKGKRQETRTVEVSVEKVNEETGETETVVTTESVTDWYGGNPFEVFVGHPTKGLSTGSYGCFAKPITIALQACGVPATNISGCSIDTVLNYVANGKPVVVWCKKNAGDLTEGVTWKYEDGNGSYTELVGEHCAVLIGYDADYVYLNDPSAGKNVKQPRAKFTSNWYKLFSQAVIIN